MEKSHYYISVKKLTIVTRDMKSLKKHLYGIVLKYICMLLFLSKTDSVKGFNLTWGGDRQNGLTLHNMLPRTKPHPSLPSSLHPPKKFIKLSQVIYYLKFIQVLSWNKYLINVLKTEQLLVKKKKNGYHQRSHFAKNFWGDYPFVAP